MKLIFELSKIKRLSLKICELLDLNIIPKKTTELFKKLMVFSKKTS